MKKLLLILVILFIFVFVSDGHKYGGKKKKCRKCPSRDDEDHICCDWHTTTYTKVKEKCKKCDQPTDANPMCKYKPKKNQYFCTFYKTKNITKTECICKCCEGWTMNSNGICTANSTNIVCENGGTANGNTCTCPMGFVGTHCETPVCDPPCMNNGMCSGQNGIAVCVCPEGMYTGSHCEIPICNPPCKNNGTCEADVYEPKCNCQPNYDGDRCEKETKDGECPAPFPNAKCNTKWQCASDAECGNNTKKCCVNGCGLHVCTYPVNTMCTYNGQHYPVGQMIRKGPCEICFCKDPTNQLEANQWECITLQCPPLPCMYTKYVAGVCCPVCDMSTTTTTRQSTPRPTTWAPTPRPTTQRPTPSPTTQRPTPRPTTQRPTPRPTTQRPTPRPTTQRPTPRPTTQRPTPRPTTHRPTPRPTTHTPTPRPTTQTQTPRPTTQTPTTRPPTTCIENGIEHQVGETIKRGSCQFCTCGYNGQQSHPVWICAVVDCFWNPNCKNQTYVEGQCCPVCHDVSTTSTPPPTTPKPVCSYNGTDYPHLSQIKKSDCETCFCSYMYGGKLDWQCVVSSCAPPPCQHPINIPGKCCPVCIATTTSTPTTTAKPVCSYNGIDYPHMSHIQKSDCESCICSYVYGGKLDWQCMVVDCAQPPCQDPTWIPGKCCPVCTTTTTSSTTKTTVPQVTGPRFHTCPREKVVLNTHHHSFVDIRKQIKLTVSDGHGKTYTVMYSKEIIYAKPCNCSDNIHMIIVRSEVDIYGRFDTCIFTVHVFDNHPPVYNSCPASIDAFEDDTISWDEPKATDNIGVKSEKRESMYENNSRFKRGSHIVSYISTDHQGNVGICNFLVTIHRRGTTNVEEVKTDAEKQKSIFSIIAGILAGLFILTVLLLLVACYRRTKCRKAPPVTGQNSYDNALYATPHTPPPSYGRSTGFILPPKYIIEDKKPPLYEKSGVYVVAKKAVDNPMYDSSDEIDIAGLKGKLRMKEYTEA